MRAHKFLEGGGSVETLKKIIRTIENLYIHFSFNLSRYLILCSLKIVLIGGKNPKGVKLLKEILFFIFIIKTIIFLN